MNKNTYNKILHGAAAALLTMAGAQSASAIGIADSPLYLGVHADPNVFFMVDDSGSMDWEILTVNYRYYEAYLNDETDADDILVRSGKWAAYARTGTCTGRDDYVYMFGNDDRLYTDCSNYATAENSADAMVRDWRVRSKDLNVLYYDPSITYEPWPGFSDATFTSVRSNPQDDQPGYDETKDLTGFVYEVWEDTHGFSDSDPSGPNSATDTPNGEIDLWDQHVRYTIGSSAITKETFTYDPTSVSSGTECDESGSDSDAYDDPPYADCMAASVTSETVTADDEDRDIDEIKQNIANWYQYHRKRSFVTKASVAAVIDAKPVFRYGLSLINDHADLFVEMPAADATSYESHNSALLSDFYGYVWGANGTPLRRGLEVAGQYFDGEYDELSSPIVPEEYGGACQKNFTVLFTDGYWRSSYDSSTLELSGDQDGDGNSVTVADVAKHYYDTDLDGDPDNNFVLPDAFDSATHQHMVTFTVAFGVEGDLVDADDDGWPDPALTESSNWGDPLGCTDCPEQIDDLWHAAYNSRGTFVSASTPQQVVNSLQAALASVEERTKVSASSVALNTGSISSDALLYQARFNSVDWSGQILAYTILSDPASSDYGRLDTSGSGPDGSQWDAGAVLDTQDWDSGRKILTYKPSSDRGIAFRWPGDPDSPTATELDPNQVTALNADPDTAVSDDGGEARLRYLRGDRSCEIEGAGSCGFDLDGDGGVEAAEDKLFRARSGVLGDVINSAPTLVGVPRFPYPNNWGDGAPENAAPYSDYKADHADRAPVLYVGANDGMLHGFSADGGDAGTELIAYVPSSLFGNLNALTDEDYTHRYYVDGSPTAGDVFYSDAWHSIVVGGLNKGGQGIYALDVTDPASFAETDSAANSTVLWEFTDADDPDLGYTFSQPALVRMQNGKWAAVFGNGYNNSQDDGAASADGHAKLFIAFIDGGIDGTWTLDTDYYKLDTGVGSTAAPNGLATVAPVDEDGDYIVDYIYAGDLEGNVWKFDVTNANPHHWDLDYKLFTACSADTCTTSNRQPITTRPEVGSAPNGSDLMVYFGTGKYLGSSDPTDTAVQSFYGVIDDGAAATGRSALLEQTIDVQASHTFSDGSTYDLRVTSDNALETTDEGWYMDLVDPDGAEPGERVVSHPLLRSGRIIFTTVVPDGSTCGSGGSGWLMEMDARDGSRLGYSPFDLNNDRAFTLDDYVWVPVDLDEDGTIDDDEGYWRPTSGKRSKEGMIPTPGVLVGDGEEVKYTPGTEGGVEVTRENPGPAGLGRQSWRQIR